MQPHDKPSLIQWCLRSLGNGAIQIEVTPDQLDDRIDEAIDYFVEFHMDGVNKRYVSMQVTSQDQTQGYFQMAANVVGVSSIFILSTETIQSASTQSFNMFDLNYQIRLNELYDFTSADYVYFELANEHIRTLEMLFIGYVPIRYNRYDNKLFCDMDWYGDVIAGSYIIAECYCLLDNPANGTPATTYWDDIALRELARALIYQQWAQNLSKYAGTPLPGGITVDAKRMLEDATAQVDAAKERMRDLWQAPAQWLIG